MKIEKNLFIIALILNFFSLSDPLFSAADSDDDVPVGLFSTPATIRMQKKNGNRSGGMTLSVKRVATSEEAQEVKEIIHDYMNLYVDGATKKNSKKIAQLLKEISKKNPEQLGDIIETTGITGCNIFQFAAAKNDKKLVKLLLEYHPAVLNSITPAHNTALHLAYRYDAKKVIAFLEKQPKLDKTIENIDGEIATKVNKDKKRPINEMEGFSIKKTFKNKKENVQK